MPIIKTLLYQPYKVAYNISYVSFGKIHNGSPHYFTVPCFAIIAAPIMPALLPSSAKTILQIGKSS